MVAPASAGSAPGDIGLDRCLALCVRRWTCRKNTLPMPWGAWLPS